MDTRVGSTIAGYRIEAVCGRGGMSVVYLADQVSLGRKVALKVLSTGLASDEAFRERFEREARQAAEIDHPNIVPVYDAGEAEGHLYIAMRYVPGRDLGSIIAAEGPLGVGRTLFVLEQAAAALDAAHARGLVHRDVKPANILVEETSERAFVADFGIAKRAASHGLTRTGFFLGSVDYAAPEQIEGGDVDARTDVYALGCVLYECLIGRSPFERENEVAVMHAHLTEPPPRLASIRPELPEALDRVIATAMAKAKDERYASCGELVGAARSAALAVTATARDGLARALPAPAAAPRLRPGRTWLAALILAAAAAATAVGVTVAVLGGNEPTTSTRTGTTGTDGGVAPSVYIPEDLLAACKDAPIYDGATATAVCTPPGGSSDVFPQRVMLSMFSSDDVYAAYQVEAAAHGFDAPAGKGACDARRWDGEGQWSHGPSSPGGSRFCYLSGNEAVLVWTHEEHGEPDHRSVLGVARTAKGDIPDLLAWWGYWRHRIGRVTY